MSLRHLQGLVSSPLEKSYCFFCLYSPRKGDGGVFATSKAQVNLKYLLLLGSSNLLSAKAIMLLQWAENGFVRE